MPIWTCPRCGSNKIGPEKARADNIVRYCLPCSEKDGRMVKRWCRKAEKRRLAARERRKNATARAAALKQKKLAPLRNVLGIDLVLLFNWLRANAKSYQADNREWDFVVHPIEVQKSVEHAFSAQLIGPLDPKAAAAYYDLVDKRPPLKIISTANKKITIQYSSARTHPDDARAIIEAIMDRYKIPARKWNDSPFRIKERYPMMRE